MRNYSKKRTFGLITLLLTGTLALSTVSHILPAMASDVTASGAGGSGGNGAKGGGGGKHHDDSSADAGNNGAGGANGAGASSNPTGNIGDDIIGNLLIQAGSGGNGGGGGGGGNGGNAHDNDSAKTPGASAPESGFSGADGEGASPGYSGNELTVNGVTSIKGGHGGTGGKGGNGGAGGVNSGIGVGVPTAGGGGSSGGKGGNGGQAVFSDDADKISLNGAVEIIGGDGANGGIGGSVHVISLNGANGKGGYGGAGGAAVFINSNPDSVIEMNISAPSAGTPDLTIHSGKSGASGSAGAGGEAVFRADGKFTAKSDLTMRIERTGAKLHAWIGTLEVAEGKKMTLNYDGDNAFRGGSLGTDSSRNDEVRFGTLFLNRDSAFETNGAVHRTEGGSGTNIYSVGNLDIVTGADWITGGTYAPDNTTPARDDYMRFDMADIVPDALMLGNSNTADLSNFDAAEQHELYLKDKSTPQYMDDPRYNSKARSGSHAFLTSTYRTKRLHLGNVTLLNNVAGGIGGKDSSHIYQDASGNLHYSSKGVPGGSEGVYDDFAYTAGLRRYYWDVYKDGASQKLTAKNYFTADASGVLLQGVLAGLATIDQTFVTGVSGSIWNLTGRMKAGESDIDAVLSYSGIEYDTGGRMDNKTFSGAISFGRKFKAGNGAATLGAFAEYGRGNYDVFKHIYRYGDVRGGGCTDTSGGGIFYAHEFSPNTNVEMSVRGGRVNGKFTLTGDPWLLHPEVHSYDAGSVYYGGHVGLNHTIPLSKTAALALYAGGRMTHINDYSFVTTFGDPIRIEGIDSARGRLGFRVTGNRGVMNGVKSLAAYIGAAWEHEFSGNAAGSLGPDGITDAPSLKGGSMFGEIGARGALNESSYLDLGVHGYAGNQKGFGARLGFEFKF